jgi:transposase-like protein
MAPKAVRSKKAVYVALGVTPEGEREVLGLWVANNEGAKFWLSVMNNLRNRGVEAEKALADFEAEWGQKYPSIAPSWRRAWQEVIPFFAFPPAVRKIIYTTNAIESLNRVIRKTTKTRGSFPTDDAATKLICLAIRRFEKAGRCVREWVAARNQFAILYPERFNR